jgi:formate dehydrogenase alpha subunit
LISKPFKFKARPWALDITKSICPFCAVGCQIEYNAKNGRVARVTSADTTFNGGNLCINGRFGYSYLNSPARLTVPLLRENDVQVRADWQRALGLVAEKLGSIVKAKGPAAVAAIGSPRVTNEESYLFQKLFRTAVGTNNIDSEARFGYARAQAVLRKSLGIVGASTTIDRIDGAGAILVLGCDLNAEATGAEYRVIKAATKNNAKLVLANIRKVKLAKFANSHLQYRPASELSLVNGLMKAILDLGLEEKANQPANVADLKSALAKVSYQEIAATCGMDEKRLKEAASLIMGKGSLAIIFGADIIKSAAAEEQVQAIANLSLLTGCTGKDQGGLFPIDEKNNIQGMLDMGVAPDHLPGYAAAGAVGKDLLQIIEAIESGSIKALYLLASDPIASFPDPARVRRALEKLELLIVQDIFPTEAAKMAHVVLPAAAAAEKTGTFTTTDGRVQRLGKAVPAPGEAREDWDILADLYNRLSSTSARVTPAELFKEIAQQVPGYAGLGAAEAGESLGVRTVSGSGQRLFVPVAAKAATPNDHYPATMLIGPILFHSGSTTTWSENNCEVAPQGYVEVAAADAAKLGIATGGAVRVTSVAGAITGKVKVSETLQPGTLFVPYHFGDLKANILVAGLGNQAQVKVEKA